MNTVKCKQCGIEIPMPDFIMADTKCDFCGDFICKSCYDKLNVVYSGSPSVKFGTSGFIKVCDECAKKHKFTEIKENPYIG